MASVDAVHVTDPEPPPVDGASVTLVAGLTLPPMIVRLLNAVTTVVREFEVIVTDRAITAIPASEQLLQAVRLPGVLQRDGMVMSGAAVQILCSGCSGIARTRPLIETVSDAFGRFVVAVPDPGTR